MKEVRAISKAEKDKVNKIIRPRLGMNYLVSCGSVTTDEDGKIYYHVGVEMERATNLVSLKKVGEIVKETFKADYVYNYGVRLV